MSTTMTTAPAPAPEVNLPSYCYPKQYAQLLSETDKHELTILHSDGRYRHLRFAAPGTGLWSFHLITWPGYLTIVGDIGGGYTFNRVDDMLRFFDTGQPAGHINAAYWAEKVTGSRRDVRAFSEDRFAEYVERRVKGFIDAYEPDDVEELRKQVKDAVLDYAWHVDVAYPALTGFRYEDHALDSDPEPGAWQDYDHHFLIALHAILWGAKKYHAHLAATAA